MGEEIPSVGLTGSYLYKLLKKKLKISHFKDVYSADTIPIEFLNSRGEPRTCIVNCARSNERGTHFLTLLVRENDILVFDSLALQIKNVAPGLYPRLKQSRKRIKYAFSRPLQDFSSAFCGIYCAYFCAYLSRDQFPNGRDKLKILEEGGEGGKNDDNVLFNLNALIKNNR